MATSTPCTTCLRTLHRQLRLQRPSKSLHRAFTTTRTSNQQPPPKPTEDPFRSPKLATEQSSILKSLASNPVLRSTTEPYVAYGATEDLLKSCTATCSYTIPNVFKTPPEPAPKDDAGQDVGEGEGWWFQPKSQGGLELPVTFNVWAQVMYLHMYALTVRLRAFPKEHVRIWEQNLLDHFFYAAEDRMAVYHGMAAKGVRNKNLKDLWVQWRGVLLSYDEGITRGDACLASAVWRNVFQAKEDVDIADVAAVVQYLRAQIVRLGAMSDTTITDGKIKFATPSRKIGSSEWMNKPFTQEDLKPLQEKAV